MTELALIAPHTYLHFTSYTNYQLMLPQFLSNPGYAKQYGEYCHAGDQFVIMDNGAAEGVYISDEELISLVSKYAPDEIVLPDSMGNMLETVNRSKRFIGSVIRWIDKFPVTPSLSFGIVLQGGNLDEIERQIDLMMEDHEPWIDTLYLPRSMNVRWTSRVARITVAEYLEHKLRGKLKIHFLGGSSLFVDELRQVAKNCPFVRGMDTSLPFNYAFAGRYILETGIPIDRPAYFWDAIYNREVSQLLTRNINEMRSWL
jgi:hypothetical protein